MKLPVRRALNYAPALIAAIAYAAISSFADPLRDLTSSTKGAAYGTFAGIAGTVLSLGVVSFSVLFAVSPRSRIAAVVAYSSMLRAWLTGAFIALGIALIGFGILVPLDSTDRPSIARYIAVGLVVAVITALAELIYLADRTFRALSRQIEAELGTQPSEEFAIVEPNDEGHKIPTH
jgi:hypothetical protein